VTKSAGKLDAAGKGDQAMRGIAAITGQPTSDGPLTSRAIVIESFEQLRAATPTTTSEIIQMEAGPMQGRLKHAMVAGLSLGFGTFSQGLVSRGIYSNERVTIGFLFGDRRSQSGRPHEISTMQIWSPGAEHERRYHRGASFGAISASVDDMARFFGPDSRFSEPSAWKKSGRFRANSQTGVTAAHTLRSLMSSFDRRVRGVSQAEAEFWKRSILEAATSVVAISEPSDGFISSPERLVRRAQEYIDRSGSALVHISELLSVLHISRRTLYRAFDEVLGVPPMKYLQHRRLCEARILLKEESDPSVTVADIAFRQGFSDFGRFSGYYRSLFGENPSETLRTARLKTL
jgi:AraC family ethanolamine operon transcriptional activator